ncbi:hypothetical protein ACH5RR_002217 [Cinchona calisaya]|uniref:B-like cyclin n=1 Tax=Cinchona calisaya TaxID=153742 RepID=A0ABD3B6A2_9GENT
MALDQNVKHQQTQYSEQQSFSLDDVLYCKEERWGDVEEEEEDFLDVCESNNGKINSPVHLSPPPPPQLLLEQDLFWEDEELLSLFSKEKETHVPNNIEIDPFLLFSAAARRDAVEWILKVNAYYGFSTLTAILAINYLDRFLSSLHYDQKKKDEDKPWMIQLASLTCLSLAAKVEEIQVPLLLDLQVVDSKYMFEAKTIQKMELFILHTLKWRMNPVTPLSFLDHIIRRLGLRNNLHWEFLRSCESLLLSVMPDSRFTSYLPSVLATATMLQVIHQVDPCNAIDYQNQLLDVLKISKNNVNDCYELIGEILSNTSFCGQTSSHKRKYGALSSPSGEIDGFFSSDSSNDSWVTKGSSDEPVMFKKSRAQEQQMRLSSLSGRVFVDFVGSPR